MTGKKSRKQGIVKKEIPFHTYMFVDNIYK